MLVNSKRINVFYAATHALFWMSFCCVVSFAAVQLQDKGYSNSQLGLILSLGNIVGFIASPLLASLADRSTRISTYSIIKLLCAIQALLLVAVYFLKIKSLLLSVCYCLLLALAACICPFLNQLCVDLSVAGYDMKYGTARGVGSLAYALISQILGHLVILLGVSVVPVFGFFIVGLELSIILIIKKLSGKVSSSEAAIGNKSKSSSIFSFIGSNPRFSFLLLGIALIFFAHNTVTNYLINIVRNLGGNTATMGSMNAFSAVLEFPVMFVFDYICRKIKCSSCVRFAAIVFSLKAAAIALAPSVPLLYAAEILQAFSYAIIIPALVRYVTLNIAPEDSGKGQSLSYGMTTLGSVFASFFGGLMYDSLTVKTTLLIATGISLTGTVICCFTAGSKDKYPQSSV